VQLKASSFDVISLRIFPSVFRMDLWSTTCWQEFRENREKRRRELQTIVDYVKSLPATDPLVFGGDFNAPPRDAVFRVLPSELSDSFHEAGRGWGATMINECPAIRIDQIWHTWQLQPCTVGARKTKFSDHRMVIGEFFVNDH
jgi:endonuclease/exonuclease/phosphatase (EEP) superfamily protein YafD